MDEEALQAPNSIRPNHRALYTAPVVRSPKSEEPLSALGDPLAHSMAWDAITEGTGFVAALSHASNQPVNDSNFSHNSQSIEQVLQEHNKQAKAIVQAAYEQNHAALNLISKSMENVCTAFTKTKHA
jgi:hypothetical protein